MTSSSVNLVVAPGDRRDDAAALARLHAPGTGSLFVPLTPGTRTRTAVAREIARALGKNAELIRRAGAGQRAWELVTAWVEAEDIHRLVVSRAHLLDKDCWRFLCDLALLCELDLWLVIQGTGLTRGQRELANELNLTPLPIATALASTPPAAHDAALEARCEEQSFPTVPREHFLVFHDRCRTLLSNADFQRVQAAYNRATFDLTCRLYDRPLAERTTVVRSLLQPGMSIDEALTALAGMQTFFFQIGWLLEYDLHGVELGHARLPVELDGDLCTALRGFLTTDEPAIAVLRVLTRRSPKELIALNMADIAADGSTARIDGDRVPVPACARPLLRAHHLARAAEGADDGAPYLASRPKNRFQHVRPRLTFSGACQHLRRASRESGYELLSWPMHGRRRACAYRLRLRELSSYESRREERGATRIANAA